VLTVLGVRRMFTGRLEVLVWPMLIGFGVKLFGSVARYWIAFDAYGGSTDAQRYHLFGRAAAGAFWAGEADVFGVLPSGSGTEFVERATAFVYTLVGSSKMAGFVMFGWFAFWGIALFVKAACITIPRLAVQRYAYLCIFAPSLVYWPSSIGKESLMLCFLGIASYGLARLLIGGGFFVPVTIGAVGLCGAGFIRPHVAGIWLAGLVLAVVVALVKALRSNRGTTASSRRIVGLGAIVVLSGFGVLSVGQVAVDRIEAKDEQTAFTDSVTAALRETTRRSDQGGSSFEAPAISGPQDWPYAVVRTLTRPLLVEARGAFQWLSALEMTAYVGLCLASWRRIVAVPRWMIRMPYLTLAVTVLFAAALAYSSFANLGVLTRQRSLLIPFLLLLPCVPPWTSRTQTVELEPVNLSLSEEMAMR
jgi:hypothetical protein